VIAVVLTPKGAAPLAISAVDLVSGDGDLAF